LLGPAPQPTLEVVPVIALFYGIRITMFWNDHAPAHFHVEYADYRAAVGILEGVVEDWELARMGRPLRSIEGLR
jgi:hypothetical protein